MSISIKMVPFILVMRTVMGKENFEKWVKSNEVRFKTNIIDEEELKDMVISSGYDFIDYGSLKKTHYNQSYMFWEKNKNYWEAIFSKYENIDLIENFFVKIKSTSNKLIFLREESKEHHKELYPTNFISEELLIEVLKNNGVIYDIIDKKSIECKLNGQKFYFVKKDNDIFYLAVDNNVDRHLLYIKMKEFDDDYKSLIQSITYENIINKIKNDKSYQIESEELLDDDSIVITISEV